MSANSIYWSVPIVAVAGLLYCSNRPATDVHLAIAKGDVARVNELLDHHPELLESRSRNGQTPLLHAVELNRVEIYYALIRRGANVNARGDDGANGLHLAAKHDFQVAAKTLLRAGTSTGTTNRDGFTPEGIAAEKQNWNIVKLLGGSVPVEFDFPFVEQSARPSARFEGQVSINSK